MRGMREEPSCTSCSVRSASPTTEATQKHVNIWLMYCLSPASSCKPSVTCQTFPFARCSWYCLWGVKWKGWTWRVFPWFSWIRAVTELSAAAVFVPLASLADGTCWFWLLQLLSLVSACGNKCSGHTTSCGLAPSHSTTLHSYSSLVISSLHWKTHSLNPVRKQHVNKKLLMERKFI